MKTNMDTKDEIKLVYEVINHSSGFDLDIAGMLCIRRYEYPKWDAMNTLNGR